MNVSRPDERDAELERRIALLEDPAHQGDEFDATSWLWLLLLGVVLPALVFAWGWF